MILHEGYAEKVDHWTTDWTSEKNSVVQLNFLLGLNFYILDHWTTEILERGIE